MSLGYGVRVAGLLGDRQMFNEACSWAIQRHEQQMDTKTEKYAVTPHSPFNNPRAPKKVLNLQKTPQTTFLEGVWSPREMVSTIHTNPNTFSYRGYRPVANARSNVERTMAVAIASMSLGSTRIGKVVECSAKRDFLLSEEQLCFVGCSLVL